MGPGRSAEMTYYETPAGAKVFAAGALNFAASIGEPVVARLVENLWARRWSQVPGTWPDVTGEGRASSRS